MLASAWISPTLPLCQTESFGVAEATFADWGVPICILACAKLPKQMTEKNIATSCFITYPPIEKYAAVSNNMVWTAVG
ncbi:hypothetical protein NTGBS_440027 [Candidatus Nitrotoga sp. BS]|nr:hypothetical protein NTGBS_440027 [Candidatus Nitrotoga sp. BS]